MAERLDGERAQYTEPFRPDADGLLPILDRPGLGIELNRDALERSGVN